MKRLVFCSAFLLLAFVSQASAQQRPLVTEDPEPIGNGRGLLEGGVDYSHDVVYPFSGLTGNLWRIATLGASLGLSPATEIQLDGGLRNHLSVTDRNASAPLANRTTFTGNTTSDFEDIVLGIKIRAVPENEHHPSFGVRFATKLPTASNESGLGKDTMDFYISALGGKTVRSLRVVGNLGVGILSDPTDGTRQNDVLTYGASVARAVTEKAELVGEVNGRVSTRKGEAFPGTETRSVARFGGRYTRGPLRLDAAIFFGLTSIDPDWGFTGGFTYVFNAFTLP